MTIGRFSGALCTLSLLFITGLTLTGCGSDAARPDAHQPAPTASASASVEPVEGGPSSPDAQVIKVEKYGISFELPKGWTTLNLKNVVDSSNPVVKEIAGRMGTTPEQFLKTVGSSLQTFSVTDQGAVEGFLDNVNSVGMPGNFNDDQLKLQLATLGGSIGEFEHVSSPAGEVTRVPYTVTIKTVNVEAHEVMLVVDVGDAGVAIAVASHSAAEAEARADQIQASLKPINSPGA
ncbi:hypothetical protein [Actinopolymorpha pittospori]|uniref:Lipoprotein n=1 Tax=Actinopolymorpha pittospori TaxID=648752 RepID=A0A927MVP9_9ACTN|nr:hypothetical protein [Actinopolymorpha pittospori]MBE1605668.1 hypothetical protein [Actinopolymorpha pittospori]